MDEPDLETPEGRLKWARARVFENRADMARAVGMVPTTYRAYENGQNGYAKFAARFASQLGVSAEWLIEGGPTPTSPPPSKPPLPDSIANTPDIPPTRDASNGDDTVPITSLDLSFSMGPGTTIDDYIEEETVKFDIGFLRSITRSPFHRLRLARGVGDSMLPTLQTSDRVLIDTLQTTLNQQDRVWAISLNGSAGIKRLRNLGKGKILVMSDNPIVEHQEVDADELRIGGRVIWFARDL